MRTGLAVPKAVAFRLVAMNWHSAPQHSPENQQDHAVHCNVIITDLTNAVYVQLFAQGRQLLEQHQRTDC